MLNTDEAAAVTGETFLQLDTAIQTALPHDVPATLKYALENNAFIFSGLKTFHTLREIGLSMLNDDGSIKPFQKFLEDVKNIDATYNRNYLYAEYNQALAASQMAAKWNDFEQDGDRYNLQYRTAGDGRVREEHAALHGITLPPSDPFWEHYLPPNGWNCRCTAVQVRKNKYPTSDSNDAIQRGKACTDGPKRAMFRFNPGKTLRLFPDKHPYYKAPAKAKKIITKMAEEEAKKRRIADLRAQLPDNLTDAEKDAKAANNYEIEKALKITCGKPMTVEQADKQSANPKYSPSSRAYRTNCQTCAPAYALRLMGFDVTAKGNTKGSLSEYLSHHHSFEAWLNADGTEATPTLYLDWMKDKGYRGWTQELYGEFFNECCKKEGVYIVTIAWTHGGGHATVLQRFSDGTLARIEPQSFDASQGARRSVDSLSKKGSTYYLNGRGILRVDNKVFNTKYLSIFRKNVK